MATVDQQTKIKQNSYKFGKTRFPFVKACLCKYTWQVFTVNSSSWSVTEITEEDFKKKVLKMSFKHRFLLCNINFKIQLAVELL